MYLEILRHRREVSGTQKKGKGIFCIENGVISQKIIGGKMLKRNPLPFWGVPSVLNRFSELSLESLNYCANRCVFCCVAKPRKKRVMTRENLAIVLERFPDFDGVVNLSNNGDPILLDDLPERVAQIRNA